MALGSMYKLSGTDYYIIVFSNMLQGYYVFVKMWFWHVSSDFKALEITKDCYTLFL